MRVCDAVIISISISKLCIHHQLQICVDHLKLGSQPMLGVQFLAVSNSVILFDYEKQANVTAGEGSDHLLVLTPADIIVLQQLTMPFAVLIRVAATEVRR